MAKNYFSGSGNQKGLTLIELAVATALTSIISLGLWQIFITTKQSYLYHENMARLLENSRLAIVFLSNDLRLANTVILNKENGDERLEISYEATRDCNNNRVKTANQPVVNQYYLKDGALMCNGNGGYPQPLVNGIDEIQFLFGESSNSSVNRYVETPTTNNIISVRITLIMQQKVFTTTVKLPESA